MASSVLVMPPKNDSPDLATTSSTGMSDTGDLSRSSEPHESPDPSLPAELGARFQSLGVLGRGGMGVVLLCRDRELDREVAIKLLGREGARLEEMMKREARVLAGLEHENVVRLYEFGLAGGKPYLVMEFVRGRTLAARLTAGRPTVLETVRLARDIASGLRVAHDRQVAHLDLKPANVFLDVSGRARVADFGLARMVAASSPGQNSSGGQGSPGGTPAYMAPEQRAGIAGLTCDIFAMGVVLHEMMTGRPLFMGQSYSEVMRIQQEEDYEPPSRANPSVPQILEDLVMSCLATDPATRPTIIELEKQLDEWLEGVTRLERRTPARGFPDQPYRFLEWFGVEDAPIFFGRGAENHELASLLARDTVNMVLVFGSCGIGKSSLIRAGLARALDPERFELELVLSGAWPAHRLLEVLLRRAWSLGIVREDDILTSVTELAGEPHKIRRLLGEIVKRLSKSIVLVLDQAEEVFTQNPPGAPGIAELFDLIGTISQMAISPVKLVVAARTEFRGDLFALEQRLGPRMQSFAVREIDDAGLREAIEGPSFIESYGFSYERDLPARIARDIAATSQESRTAALPTLQIICRQLYDEMRADGRRVILHDHYDRVLGGARGALRRYLEERLSRAVHARGGAIARQILEALTVKTGEGDRFARPREEIELLDFEDRLEANRSLDQLIADRLVVRDVTPDGHRMVRLTSEVICPTIDSWSTAPDPTQVAGRVLARAYRLWDEGGRVEELRLAGTQLAQVREHLDGLRAVSVEERRFVEFSIQGERRLWLARKLVGASFLVLAVAILYVNFFKPGELELGSDPEGARVTLAGVEIGRTPLRWSSRPGIYPIVLEKEDHESVELPVQLHPGGQTVLSPLLPYRRGFLEVSSKPENALCVLHPAGKTPGTTASLRTPFTTEVLQGEYTLEVSSPGWQTVVLPGVVIQGNRKLTHRRADLRRESGWVAAGSPREGAVIKITELSSGRMIAEEALPLTQPLRLPTGTHRAECHGREGRVDYIPVEISPETTTTISPWIPALSTAWQARDFAPGGTPAVADLDGDGRPDLVFGSEQGAVVAISGMTGSILWSYPTGGPVLATPGVGDLDQDGVPDVAAPSHDGTIHAISGRTGLSLWAFPTGGKAQSNPALHDMNGDGVLDVIAGSCDSWVYVIDGSDGSLVWKAPTQGEVYADPCLVEIDGDAIPDVLIGSDDRKLRALSGARGHELWSRETGGDLGNGAILARLDEDPIPDGLVIATDRKLYAIGGRDGKVIWATSAERGFDGVPARIGDQDGDGLEDLVAVSANYHEVVGIAGKDGGVLWTRAVAGSLWPTPIAVDLGGDGTPEVVVASPTRTLVLAAASGVPLWGIDTGRPMKRAPGVVDLEADGTPEILHFMGSTVFPISASSGNHLWSHAVGGVLRHLPALSVPEQDADAVDVMIVTQDRKVRKVGGGDGETIWTHDAGNFITANPVAASLDGDGLPECVVVTTDGRIRVIEGADGRMLWERGLGARIDACPAILDVDGDRRHDLVAGTSAGRVVALAGIDGKILWDLSGAGPIGAAPCVGDLDGEGPLDVTFGTTGGKLHAYSGAGRLLWSRSFTASLEGASVIEGGVAISGAGDGTIAATAGSTGKPLWIHQAPDAIRAGPVLADVGEGKDRSVIFAEQGGSIRALSSATGDVRWVRLTEQAGGFDTAPAALADVDQDGWEDVLVVQGETLLVLSGESGEILRRTSEAFAGFKQPVLHEKAPGDFRLFMGAGEALVARRLRAAPGIERRDGARSRSLWRYPTGGSIRGAAAIAAASRLVAVGSLDGLVHAIDPASGVTRWRFNADGGIIASVAVADLAPAPGPEVIAVTNQGQVWALEGESGRAAWSATVPAPVLASPAIVRADDDEALDVIVADRAGSLHALSGVSGKSLWTRKLAGAFYSSPAIADVDGDGSPDATLGTEEGAVLTCSPTDGTPRWSVTIGPRVRAAPAVLESTPPGPARILAVTETWLVCLSGTDGHELWRVDLGSRSVSSPAPGDLDGDGVPEVLIGTESGACHAFSALTGKRLWSRPTGDRISGRPAAATLPGGGAMAVAGSCDGLVHAWAGATGDSLWTFGAGSPVDWSSPMLTDLDADGYPDVLVGDRDGYLHAISGAPSLIRGRTVRVTSVSNVDPSYFTERSTAVMPAPAPAIPTRGVTSVIQPD